MKMSGVYFVEGKFYRPIFYLLSFRTLYLATNFYFTTGSIVSKTKLKNTKQHHAVLKRNETKLANQIGVMHICSIQIRLSSFRNRSITSINGVVDIMLGLLIALQMFNHQK